MASRSRTTCSGAHGAAADAARGAQVRAGVTLGPLLEQHAPGMYAPVEDELGNADAEVRESLTALAASWCRWSGVFAMRRWLSHVATQGGPVPAFHGGEALSAEVAQALGVLTDHLAQLDRLKSDERELAAWRDTQRAAAESNARAYGTTAAQTAHAF